MFIINVVPILRITLSLLQSSSFKSECFYILFHFSVVGENDKSEGSGPNAAAVAVPVVLLLLLIPAVVVAVFFYRRWVSTARKRYTRCSFSVKREKDKIERFILRLKFPLTVYFFTSLFLSLLALHFRHCCSQQYAGRLSHMKLIVTHLMYLWVLSIAEEEHRSVNLEFTS